MKEVKAKVCSTTLSCASQRLLPLSYGRLNEKNVSNYKVTFYVNYDSNINILHMQGILVKPQLSTTFNSYTRENHVFIKESYITYCNTDTKVAYEAHYKTMIYKKEGYSKDISYTTVTYDKIKNSDLWEITLNIVTLIPEKTLIRDKIIYIRELNLVISNGVIPHNFIHPLKCKGSVNDMYDNYPGHSCYIEIVDNKNPSKIYYAKVGGNILEIPSGESSVQDDGVHLTIKHKGKGVHTVYASMEDIHIYGIYPTHHDAVNADEYRDVKLQKELQVNIATMKKELLKLQDNINLEKRDRDVKIGDMTIEYDIKISNLESNYVKAKGKFDEKLETYKNNISVKQEKLNIEFEKEITRLNDMRNKDTYESYITECNTCSKLAMESNNKTMAYLVEAVQDERITLPTKEWVKKKLDEFNSSIPINLLGYGIAI